MMKHEFEKIAGYEVSAKDYNEIIEPMYNATDLDKIDFVKCIDKKRFALPSKRKMENDMKKIADHLRETAQHYTDYDARDKLNTMACEYVNRFYYGLNYFIDQEYPYGNYRGCPYPKSIVVVGKYGFKDVVILL